MRFTNRLDEHARRLADELAGRSTRRSALTRVGQTAMAVVAGQVVLAAINADDAEAGRFCGHIGPTKGCPSPQGAPRIDRHGLPLDKHNGKPIDNLGRPINAAGQPVDAHGQRLIGPDGDPLPAGPRTRLCQDWVPELYGHRDARLQGSWYRCCNGQIRKLWDCCSHSHKRINGDAALHGYCNPGERVFCVTYRDTGLPC
jgi:hypothetical protein